MYTDVFLIDLVRLSLNQNIDECVGWVGDVVCMYNWGNLALGKPDCKWCDGSEGISRKWSRALSIEETLRGFWGGGRGGEGGGGSSDDDCRYCFGTTIE